jgi:hypothetical protein
MAALLPVSMASPAKARPAWASSPQTRYEALRRQVQHDAVQQASDARAELATQERLALAQEQVARLEREWRSSSSEASRLAAELQKERSRAERRHLALKKASEAVRAARQEDIEAAVRAERARCEDEIHRLRKAAESDVLASRVDAEARAQNALESMAAAHAAEVEGLRAAARERSALHASRLRLLMESEEEAQQTCGELYTRLQGAAAANLALVFRLRRASRAATAGAVAVCALVREMRALEAGLETAAARARATESDHAQELAAAAAERRALDAQLEATHRAFRADRLELVRRAEQRVEAAAESIRAVMLHREGEHRRRLAAVERELEVTRQALADVEAAVRAQSSALLSELSDG